MPFVIGVLALQGAFREHRRCLERCGASVREVRRLKDTEGIDGLVVPGGESTTMGRLLVEEGLLEPLRERIEKGMPVYGTCAGLILLCRDIEHSAQPRFGVLDATVRRNAFGRQTDSFETALAVKGVEGLFHAVFIRAPVLTWAGPGVEVLAKVGENAVAVRQKNVLATSFHPELTDNLALHRFFFRCVKREGVRFPVRFFVSARGGESLRRRPRGALRRKP